MVLNDPLANMLSKIQNALRVSKTEIQITPVSRLMLQVLELLKAHGYIGEVEVHDSIKGKIAVVKSFEKINKCGVIKPRFNFKIGEIIEHEQHFLPAKDFGLIIVSTPKGIMTIDAARKAHTGGKLVAYCY
ncbi:MAG TPA: 30S ribosomal protein S8 [Acidobacteriota bacterium]|nr:30S ribosomal protein S8 [Acidobacteriota bacterium]